MLAFLSYLAKGESELAIDLGGNVTMTVKLPPMMFEAPVTVSEGEVSEEEIPEVEDSDIDDWTDEAEELIHEEEDL